MKNRYQARRKFLKGSLACAVVGSGAAAIATKLNLVGASLASSEAGSDTGAGSNTVADNKDYKALVCVFLYGGSDSFNLFIPGQSDLYKQYAQARGSLSLAESDLLNSRDGAVRFNKNLPNLLKRYEEGNAALVTNVGNLIVPVTREGIASGNASIPADLFAHNHQQEQWQKSLSSQPTSLVSAGWGGRMADLLADTYQGSALPPTFTVSGANFFQTGKATSPVSVDPRYGPSKMDFMDSSKYSSNAGREKAMAQILALENNHVLQQFASSSYSRAKESSRLLSEVMAENPESTYDFSTRGSIGSQLKMVARLIAGRKSLGQQRQIFFVGMGGWDTHDAQSARLGLLAQDLDKGLNSFQEEIAEQGLSEQVTTFTASDFGRTLTVNGDGSDHGWGGHYLVMGGAVNGKKVLGDWPSYQIGGADDTGDKGRVIPSMSVNQYGAALASWMGLSGSQIHDIFPDLSNFNDDWTEYGLFNS